MRFHTGLAFAGSLLALALGGCGSSSADDGVPSANGGTATPSASSTTGNGDAQRYAQCIRDNGVPDFPDPDANGNFSGGLIEGLDRADLQKAMEACQALAPQRLQNAGKQMTPEQVEKWTTFAGCMRDNGFDIPDPDPNGALIDWTRTWAGSARSDPKFEQVSQTCMTKAGINISGSGR